MRNGKTQKTTILNHLMKHREITPLQAHHLYGVYRLSDVIMKLRRDHVIETEMHTAPNGSSYGKYVYVMRKEEEVA